MEISHTHLLNRPAYPHNMVFKKVSQSQIVFHLLFFNQKVLGSYFFLLQPFVWLDGDSYQTNARQSGRGHGEATEAFSNHHIKCFHGREFNNLDDKEPGYKGDRGGAASGQYAL